MKRAELPGLLKNAFLVVTLFNRQRVWCEKNVCSIKLTFTETWLLIKRRKLLNILLFMAKKHTLLCSPDPLASGSAPDILLTSLFPGSLFRVLSLPGGPPGGKPGEAGRCREGYAGYPRRSSLPVYAYQITIVTSQAAQTHFTREGCNVIYIT